MIKRTNEYSCKIVVEFGILFLREQRIISIYRKTIIYVLIQIFLISYQNSYWVLLEHYFHREVVFESIVIPAGREISTPGGTKLWHLCHKFTFTFEYIKMSQSLPNYVDNIIKPFFT